MAMTPERWLRVKELLAAALTRTPADRAAFIGEAAAGDALLQREIESLLNAYEAAGSFLDESPRSSEPARSAVGRRIGSYRFVSLIAAGGMGDVYLARDAKLDRDVAIKVLPPELAEDPARLRRFHQEARAASSLNHPHILVIHDFGELDGRPFIVTEFVEGETLRDRLRAGPLAIADAIAIAIQVAGALGAAHARGIVHRDVKPENVMVRPDGLVKVVDFGLAKLGTAQLAVDTSVTHPGLLIGTPRYMSPEQARALPVDARSDIWSLGVVLYELVTGDAPFAAATAADLIAGIVGGEPVPAALRIPSLPAPVERVIARSLRKDPADRYASMGEVVAELTAAGKQVEAAPPRTGPAAATGAAFEMTPPGRTAPRTRLIVVPFRLLRPDTEIEFVTFSLADAIATTLSGIDAILVRSTLMAARFAGATLDVQRIASDADVDAVLTGTLLRAGSRLRVTAQLMSAPHGTIVWSERMDVPVDDLIRLHDDLTDRIVKAVSRPLTPHDQQMLRRDAPASPKAYELYLRGNQHFYTDQWTVARDLFLESVQEDAGYAPAWARLGRCYRLTAKFRSDTVAEMREHLSRAEVAFGKAFELNPDLPLAHHLYTPLETDLGRSEEALLRLLRRVAVRRGDPALYAGLVHACRYCGLLDESVAAHEAARQLDPHVETGVVNTYWLRGEYDRALVGMTGFFVGLSLVSLGRYDEARAAARASAATVRDPTTRSYQSILPLLLEGRSEECVALLDELAPRNPDPESIYFIARTYARLGALVQAVAQFERAIDGGFVPSTTFGRDEWLDSMRADPRFQAASARATARRAAAAMKFREAGGPRLLGLA